MKQGTRAALLLGALGVLELLYGGVAWAQATYEAYDPAATAYVYSGLSTQMSIRAHSSMANIPSVIVVCSILYLLVRQLTAAIPQPFINVVMYFITASMVTVLFWPEAIGGLFPRAQYNIYPNAITAYTSRTGGYTRLDNAEKYLSNLGSTRFLANAVSYQGNLATMTAARVPVLYHMLLKTAIEVPISLAEVIGWQDGTKMPFGRLFGAEGMNGIELDAEAKHRFRTDLGPCYFDALKDVVPMNLIQRSKKVASDYRVWSPLIQARFDHLYDNPAGGGAPKLCKTVYDETKNDLQELLDERIHPHNPKKIHVALTEKTAISLEQQVLFFIDREMRRLTAEYGFSSQTLDDLIKAGVGMAAASAVAGAGEKMVQGAAAGAMAGSVVPGKGNLVGGIVGAVMGAVGHMLGSGRQQIDALMHALRPAVLLLWFLPHVTGMLTMLTIGFFPFVVLWSLFPNQHFKPLANYFLVLFFVSSGPLWIVLADSLGHIAFNAVGGAELAAAGTDEQDWEQLKNWFNGHVTSTFVSLIAVFSVPFIEATLLFGAWRAIGGSLKGA